MTKELTDAEWLRGYIERQRVHSYIMSKYEYDYLRSIAAKLEQQEKPVREVPEIVDDLQLLRSADMPVEQKLKYALGRLAEHFEKDAK